MKINDSSYKLYFLMCIFKNSAIRFDQKKKIGFYLIPFPVLASALMAPLAAFTKSGKTPKTVQKFYHLKFFPPRRAPSRELLCMNSVVERKESYNWDLILFEFYFRMAESGKGGTHNSLCRFI